MTTMPAARPASCFEPSTIRVRQRAAAVVRRADGRVLLHCRKGDGFWALPGGAIEPLVDGASAGGAYEAEAMKGEADMPLSAMMMRAEAAPAPVAPSRGPEAISVEGDVGITFTLPQPVTLKAGATLGTCAWKAPASAR